jgi:hypothetical protein
MNGESGTKIIRVTKTRREGRNGGGGYTNCDNDRKGEKDDRRVR